MQNYMEKHAGSSDKTHAAATAAAKTLQSCPTLCDPTDGSPPGSLIPGILQARTLEWVAISFSNAWKWKVKVKSLSRVRLLVTPWTAAHQAPPPMGFSMQESWSGVPLLSPDKCHIHLLKQNCWVALHWAANAWVRRAKMTATELSSGWLSKHRIKRHRNDLCIKSWKWGEFPV